MCAERHLDARIKLSNRSTDSSLLCSNGMHVCLLPHEQEPGEHDPYMDPLFLNGSQDGSRGRGGPLGRGRGGPPGAGGPRYALESVTWCTTIHVVW